MAIERWDTYNLPLPKMSGYGYTVDAGLIRTPMDSGYHYQRRRWDNRPTQFTLTFELSTAELQTVSEWINTYGYTWFYMPLISGANGMPQPMDHLVRFMDNLDITATGWDLYELSSIVEMKESTPACTLLAYCDEMIGCLSDVDLTDAAPSISATDWAAIAAAWGDETYWGNDNG